MYEVLEGKDMKESSARGGGGVCACACACVFFVVVVVFLMLTYRQEPITWPTSIDMVAG